MCEQSLTGTYNPPPPVPQMSPVFNQPLPFTQWAPLRAQHVQWPTVAPVLTLSVNSRIDPEISSALQSVTSPRIAAVVSMAREAWGDGEKSIRFLLKPHPALNGETPLAMSVTDAGASKVRWLLGAIMHGLPA